MNKKTFFISALIPLCCGCIGFDVPQPYQNKPFTYFKGGDQLGRDTIENRVLVAMLKFPIKGFVGNDVLSILGQPQQIHVVERNVSEDWYFVYDKTHVAYVPKVPGLINADKPGTFMVRLYNNKVIDVVNID